MKGFMIYETPLWGDEENVVYLQEVKNASYTLKQIGSDDITCYLEGTATKDPVTKSRCNKEDTYDFETGALIALMKMCGVEKVVRACNEAFSEDTFKTYAIKYEKELNELKKDFDKAKDLEEFYKKNYEERLEENKNLKKENNHLRYVKSCNESTIESLEKTRDLLINKNNELIEENEKLQLDCEMLQHGYNDINILFCGGRQNGKQYTFLVELFKKIPKDKVQAAYVAAYKESLIWCTSQPSIRKSLEKYTEQINKLTVDSLIEQSRAFTRKCVDEWLYKPPTKREEMWEKIFANDKVVIKVKKEDVNTFLRELEERDDSINWVTNLKPTEVFKNQILMKEAHSEKHCYFYLKQHKLSYAPILLCNYKNYTIIDYLSPMRWDLFKKGRIVVGVKNNNELVEFRKEVERNSGIKNIPMCPTNLCLFYSFDKDNYKIILETIEEFNIAKINNHKVVYWEDVR